MICTEIGMEYGHIETTRIIIDVYYVYEVLYKL